MNPERQRLALRASSAALKARKQGNIASGAPCNVFDLAIEMGIEVRFAPLPSAEGVYSPGKPVIVVSSLRPQGRQSFTCAHELGHHIYGHGEQFDELVEERGNNRRYDPKEFEANCFASELLMPKTTLLRGLAARGWNVKNLSAEQCYRIASWLGVGYVTLIRHLHLGMELLTRQKAADLEQIKLPQIRESILGEKTKEHLVLVDECWNGRPIDARVDDLILLPSSFQVEGNNVTQVRNFPGGCLVKAIRPGIGRATLPHTTWAQYIRVSRKEFKGLAMFRHLEEVEDE
ncbi:ImmA/IrrE family metallo-endopeptidase [Silvibacterium acidisoli]|uniref:ImmA/IrrE family metallo-endopeptidase n=1 Tax=Acidobacteriaceae bacterium ZG23-2 TaxID=2883246 RepID=UPI00406D4488